jgi:hypothetical protein
MWFGYQPNQIPVQGSNSMNSIALALSESMTPSSHEGENSVVVVRQD